MNWHNSWVITQDSAQNNLNVKKTLFPNLVLLTQSVCSSRYEIYSLAMFYVYYDLFSRYWLALNVICSNFLSWRSQLWKFPPLSLVTMYFSASSHEFRKMEKQAFKHSNSHKACSDVTSVKILRGTMVSLSFQILPGQRSLWQ